MKSLKLNFLGKVIRNAIVVVFTLYFTQFGMIALQNQSPMLLGEVIQELSFIQTESTNSSNEPVMRSVFAKSNVATCTFWNFEGLWGRCANAFIDVLDYSPSDHASVLHRASVIADVLSRPCETLASFKIKNASRLKSELGCGSSWRPFRIVISLSAVKRREGPLYGKAQNQYFWNVETVQPDFLLVQRRGEL
jgi:hypothetical protein